MFTLGFNKIMEISSWSLKEFETLFDQKSLYISGETQKITKNTHVSLLFFTLTYLLV